jgi:tRNA A37 threonylcarbamoyladenosine dehydratase
MGTGNKIQPELLKIGDIAKTSVCPLARAVRRELRKEGVSSGVTVVWSEEAPLRKKAGTADGFSPGSVSFVPPVAGMLLAGEVIRQLIVLEEK